MLVKLCCIPGLNPDVQETDVFVVDDQAMAWFFADLHLSGEFVGYSNSNRYTDNSDNEFGRDLHKAERKSVRT